MIWLCHTILYLLKLINWLIDSLINWLIDWLIHLLGLKKYTQSFQPPNLFFLTCTSHMLCAYQYPVEVNHDEVRHNISIKKKVSTFLVWPFTAMSNNTSMSTIYCWSCVILYFAESISIFRWLFLKIYKKCTSNQMSLIRWNHWTHFYHLSNMVLNKVSKWDHKMMVKILRIFNPIIQHI